MSNKKQSRRALLKYAADYIDIKSLFPKSNIDLRKPLTDYQNAKLARELKHLSAVAGGANDKKHPTLGIKITPSWMEKSFVPVKRTKGAKQYITDSMLPKSAKGILLPGGKKINSGVSIKDGAIFFNRGQSAQAMFPLDAVSEKKLEKSIRANSDYINNPDNVSYIATASGKITGVNVLHGKNKWERVGVFGTVTETGYDAVDDITKIARDIFNKYAMMAKEKAMRANGRRAVHPSKWGMSLLVEQK